MTLFNLDTPSQSEITYLTTFSGWYIPPTSDDVKLSLYLNDQPYAALCHGIDRPDVAAAYPDLEGALESGFFGDLLLPRMIKAEDKIDIKIFAEQCNQKLLFHKKYRVLEVCNYRENRQRAFNINQILRCPDCGESFSINEIDGCCNNCGNTIQIRGLTPNILQKDELPFLRLTEQHRTHPYSPDAMEFLDKFANGIVLDFGAGNTPQEYLRPNICYLDVQQYPYTDVVCSKLRLPFPDAIFDAIISQAVFEHLPNPFFTASELYRILKPGGLIHIDTAFMQPLHGDPSHYFNMTIYALKVVMSNFEELKSGIKPYQEPSFGLLMQIASVLPYMTTGLWKNRLEELYGLLLQSGKELDKALGEKGRKILAAGVFFEGQKPI